jgi:hypothetical protein
MLDFPAQYVNIYYWQTIVLNFTDLTRVEM